jgi:hypothetical protein
MKIKTTIKALLLKAIDRILINELYMAYNGDNLFFALWDLDQWLRGEIKYNDKEEFQVVRDKLHEYMDEHNIDFEHVE